jgi:hypothetical protein
MTPNLENTSTQDPKPSITGTLKPDPKSNPNLDPRLNLELNPNPKSKRIFKHNLEPNPKPDPRPDPTATPAIKLKPILQTDRIDHILNTKLNPTREIIRIMTPNLIFSLRLNRSLK